MGLRRAAGGVTAETATWTPVSGWMLRAFAGRGFILPLDTRVRLSESCGGGGSMTDHECYACDEKPVALVHKGSQGPLPMCESHLEKANKIGLVDDSEMP